MLQYNPLNERFKKLYEESLLHGAYKQARTVDSAWKAINLFENFTCRVAFTAFSKEQAKDFKHWLSKKRNKKGEPLSLSTIRTILSNLRDFFKWLAMHPECIRKVDGQAVAYLRLSDNDERASRASRERTPPTIDEVHKVLESMPINTAIEKRDRAIIAFTALSGVRDSALISLKLGDVDILKEEIWQNPKHVKTKNRKGISTYFMNFDPLWKKIIVEWVEYAQKELGFNGNDPLFPQQKVENTSKEIGFEVTGLSTKHWASTTAIRQIFRKAFEQAGLSYYNPHSFRNMLVTWALENCNQFQVKALSQNLGHEHIMTTYNSYGTLNKLDQRKAILNITSASNQDLRNIPDNELLEEMQRRFKR